MMLLASLDHSPSEQLVEPDEWHTTALLLSEGGEHWDQFPSALAARMGRDGLEKWAGGKSQQTYRTDFRSEFYTCLADFPVHARAISAQANVIAACFESMIKALGLGEDDVRRKGTHKVEFGPFLRGSYGQKPHEWRCVLPEHQAMPLVFLCFFLQRTHKSILQILKNDAVDVDWVDWQIMHDPFPGATQMRGVFSALRRGDNRCIASYICRANSR